MTAKILEFTPPAPPRDRPMTSYERCLANAEEMRRTHYQRQREAVERSAKLPGVWSARSRRWIVVPGELRLPPVLLEHRKRKTWWDDESFWRSFGKRSFGGGKFTSPSADSIYTEDTERDALVGLWLKCKANEEERIQRSRERSAAAYAAA